MSKKHKKHHNHGSSGGQQMSFAEHTQEYNIIQKDLVRLVILNVLFLVAVLAVYYTNNSSHYLEKIFAPFLNF